MNIKHSVAVFVIYLLFITTSSASASQFDIIGWIPYWRTASGTADAINHINSFTEINPFGYTVKKNGDLFDAMKLASSTKWQTLIQTAKDNKVKVVPTVMWSDGNAINNVLKNKTLRNNHVAAIVKMVNDNNFDGVDIDYEQKLAVTKNYFSLFLKELKLELKKKTLVCSIEPRTPLDSRYDTIPKTTEYANDFVAINKYCDKVIIMAYDQGTIDLKLNRANKGPYHPISDINWVKKLITLASKSISKNKMILGVATYGHETRVISTNTGYKYKFLWSFNPKYATDIAVQQNIVPQRNSAGELSFIYYPLVSVVTTPPAGIDLNDDTLVSSENSSSQNSATIATSSIRAMYNMIWWSDATAVKQKYDLAKKLGLKGIAIFKIDGGEDQNIWNQIK